MPALAYAFTRFYAIQLADTVTTGYKTGVVVRYGAVPYYRTTEFESAGQSGAKGCPSAVQYSTAQHSVAKGAVQYSTVQYGTARHSRPMTRIRHLVQSSTAV